MTYLPMGDVSSDSFNSTKYPGVCKPSTVAALTTFKRMQHNLNRCAVVSGASTIAVDGDIGPGTVTLFGRLKSHLGTYALGNNDTNAAIKIAAAGSSCSSIAAVADVIANIAESYADDQNAPTSPPAPKPIKPPTLVSSTGLETPAPAGSNLLAVWGTTSTPVKLAALGILGGIGYFAFMKKPRRRR
jgi:hypothetical protein